MQNLKNEKGSITLFVLTSAMFFVMSVVGVNINLQTKEMAVDKEYKQIKSNYETNIDNMDSIYQELSQRDSLDNINIDFLEPVIEQDENTTTISEKFTIDLNKFKVKTLQYGWIYSDEVLTEEDMINRTPSEWIYSELANSITATKIDEKKEEGYYYLCILIKDNLNKTKVIWSDKVVEIN